VRRKRGGGRGEETKKSPRVRGFKGQEEQRKRKRGRGELVSA